MTACIWLQYQPLGSTTPYPGFINSTVTGASCKVFAYTITSTAQSPTKISFYGGSSLKWPIVLAAISSAVTGANLSVSPPAYLFKCAQGS